VRARASVRARAQAADPSPVAASEAALVSAHGLAIGYRVRGGREIIDCGNLELGRGRFVCLIGPNGSGKSTLLSTLGGLMPPLRGSVLLGGSDVARMSARDRALSVSYVLPESPRPAWITGREIVSLGRYPSSGFLGARSSSDDEAVDAAIDAMGARPIAARIFAELSDGERQKLLMARALAQGSPLLLLDEPTMFLDSPTRVETMALLRRVLRSEGRSAVMALHEIDLALDWADELWIADRAGKRLVRGVPEELAMRGEIGAAYGRTAGGGDAGPATAPRRETDDPSGPSTVIDAIFPRSAAERPLGSVTVAGEGPAAFWAKRLLARLGFTVNGPDPIARADIDDRSGEVSWRLVATGTRSDGILEGDGLTGLEAAALGLADEDRGTIS